MNDKGDFKSFNYYPQESKSQFPEIAEAEVSQNEYIEKVIRPSDKKVHIIHTKGRIGCDAALLLTIEDGGTEHAVVTHYDPNHLQEHLTIISEKTKLHPKGKRFSVLLTSGDETDEWRKKVEEALKNYSGNPPEVIAMSHLGVEEAKELSQPINRLKYQLSFIKGYGGDTSIHRVSIEGSNYDRKFATKDL